MINRVFMTEVVADSVQFLEPRSAQDSKNSFSNYQGEQMYGRQPQKQYGQNRTPPNYEGRIEVVDDDLLF